MGKLNLDWWFHRCVIIFKLIKLHLLHTYIFGRQSYLNRVFCFFLMKENNQSLSEEIEYSGNGLILSFQPLFHPQWYNYDLCSKGCFQITSPPLLPSFFFSSPSGSPVPFFFFPVLFSFSSLVFPFFIIVLTHRSDGSTVTYLAFGTVLFPVPVLSSVFHLISDKLTLC